ncbi:hypothetical protein SAMN04488128_1011418 [Chitinophaga eiseniae]|uniref:Dolichyl-phosphate-mannose-protein mannosyltransferase n=1 Tax=Chitinophaga eiseniae TaxID=634771 RepID=A0A1T4N4G8_9BACT|nr:DUF2142 domain-containing protein [Chitinophaga eiseniae]SJZ74054.1 hypothetical protein SAMN04488128_1011418 [Chitinophaga eiseniae]
MQFSNDIKCDSEFGRGISFKDFLVRDGLNRKLIIFSCLLVLLQLLVFKYFYPYPAFINGDSYQYLLSATGNLKIDFYPIGYPKFLRLISVFSSSHTVVVSLQYMLMQFGTLFWVFSLFYFYRINRIIRILLIVAVVLSPIQLYMANYISSDSLFYSVSICWFATNLWVVNRFSWKVALIHAVLLVLAFSIRYNALYYPLVSCIALVVARGKVWLKLTAAGLIFMMLGVFVIWTSVQYKKLTGEMQFSAFSGWQMANNGMYAYRFVDSIDQKPLPPKFKELDYYVRSYFDSTRYYDLKYPEVMLDVNAFYMWSPISPLRMYMKNKFERDTVSSEFKKWSVVAPLYKEYGMFLMKNYPKKFATEYVWPNFIKYYAPPVEFLGMYGYKVDTVMSVVNTWFDFKEKKLNSRFKDYSVRTLESYPIICGTMNAVFIMMTISFFVLNGRNINKRLFELWSIFFLFWILNLGFSVFASPIALRFQIFPLVVYTSASFLMLSFVLDQAKNVEQNTGGRVVL